MNSSMDELPTSLLDLLSNSLILGRVAPLLPVRSLLSLCAASKSIRSLLDDSPETFRYLDLSTCKSAIVPDMSVDHGGVNWRSQRMDEALTEDDIYCGPLRGIFNKLDRQKAMSRVQTLILDGLTVPADLIAEIISNTNVRTLSVKECRNLNQTKLAQVLKYAVRPSRPKGTPRLKCMYVFGPRNPRRSPGQTRKGAPASVIPGTGARTAGGVMTSQGAQIGAQWNSKSHDALSTSLDGSEDRWYKPSGKMFALKQAELSSWAEALQACHGIIYFDAVLCRGPRHDAAASAAGNDLGGEGFLPAAIATISLGGYGCVSCKSSAEGPAIFGQSPAEDLPLLGPPPLQSAAVQDAQRPIITKGTTYPHLFARCEECLKSRWCERCFKWWDERCYSLGPRTSEVRQAAMAYENKSGIRVYLGLCTESCLASEEMSGSGSGGMWG